MRSWRIWSTLPFFVIAALAGITALIAKLSGTDMDGITWQGLPAFLLVGAGLYFWGRQLNITGPTKKLAAPIAQRNSEVEGTALTSVHLDPEQPVFTQEEQAVLKRMQNRYTMLFLPLQWWGYILPAIGIVVTVGSMISSN